MNALLMDLELLGPERSIEFIDTLRHDYRNVPICLIGLRDEIAELRGIPPNWKLRFAHYHKLAADPSDELLAARVAEEVVRLKNWIRGRLFILSTEESRDPKYVNTVFIMMRIDAADPICRAVHRAIRTVCEHFSLKAVRADDIEHQESATAIVLEHIRNCDFLVADLTHARPNVYYEVGYAHALGRTPILLRAEGQPLHFDLSVHNVPEYKSPDDLMGLLRKRLAALSSGPVLVDDTS